MHENRNLLLFLIEINNMHHTRHILPTPRTCIWGRCGWCGVSWHRPIMHIPQSWVMSCMEFMHQWRLTAGSGRFPVTGSGYTTLRIT